MKNLTALTALACLVCAATPALAQFPTGIVFTPVFGTDGGNHFDHAMTMDEMPGKPGYFLVTEAVKGKIWLLAPGASGYTKTQFLQISVNPTDPDMGLGGIVFHPDFATNHKYYVKFGDANSAARTLKLAERTASANFLTDSGTQPRILLSVRQPDEFKDHNGGGLVFGTDGYLYIGIGDGGWDVVTPDVHNNGQNREVLLGKILRIDVNRKDPGLEYGIPTDNPYVTDANPNVRREIYAYGARNPFRMTRDRVTGEIYIADVGLDKFEKVNLLRKGANYGWKLQEYTYCFKPGTCNDITVDKPAGYASFGPVKCFIGGQIYRGDATSPFYGAYIFGDHMMKRLLAFKKSATGPVAVTDMMTTPAEMTGFTLDSQNNLYMVAYEGTIYKLDHPALKPGVPTALAAPRGHLALLADKGFGIGFRSGTVSVTGSLGIFGLDGKRQGRLEADGMAGKSNRHGTGLAILAPTP